MSDSNRVLGPRVALLRISQKKGNADSSSCFSFVLVPLSKNQTHGLSSSTTWNSPYLPGNRLLSGTCSFAVCTSAWKTYSNFSIPARLASLLFFKHASHSLTFKPLQWLLSLPGMFFPHVSTWLAPHFIVSLPFLPLGHYCQFPPPKDRREPTCSGASWVYC